MKLGSVWTVPSAIAKSRVGSQKQLAQVPTRGNRISILGLWQPDNTFEYPLAQGGFDGESYIKVMNSIAAKAAPSLVETGRLTVVVQDKCSMKKRDIVQQYWQPWQHQGLVLFLLPTV